MKVPSLFRIPRYQRFNIVPRHYDPIKEEIEQRTSQIKREMSEEEEGDLKGRSSRIVGAFKTGRSKSGGSATFMQLIIMMLLAFMIFGYIYLGNIALYIFVTASALLLYLKMKRII
jgi:hypothetical protein